MTELPNFVSMDRLQILCAIDSSGRSAVTKGSFECAFCVFISRVNLMNQWTFTEFKYLCRSEAIREWMGLTVESAE